MVSMLKITEFFQLTFKSWHNLSVLKKYIIFEIIWISSIQSLSCVWLFATPWTAACQVSLSITNSQSFAQTHVHGVHDAIQPSRPL